jgi:hypothetical protein
MPRLDVQATPETTTAYETQMLLGIMLHQLNILRTALDLPLLEAQDVRQAVRRHLRDHPRPERGHGG